MTTFIANSTQLQSWLNNPTTNAEVTNDFTISSPLTASISQSNTIFDGYAHTISVDISSGSWIPPFSFGTNGTFRCIKFLFLNTALSGNPNQGLILQDNSNGIIDRIEVISSITSTSNNWSGFIGTSGNDINFQNCVYNGRVPAISAGGFAYHIKTTNEIKSCVSKVIGTSGGAGFSYIVDTCFFRNCMVSRDIDSFASFVDTVNSQCLFFSCVNISTTTNLSWVRLGSTNFTLQFGEGCYMYSKAPGNSSYFSCATTITPSILVDAFKVTIPVGGVIQSFFNTNQINQANTISNPSFFNSTFWNLSTEKLISLEQNIWTSFEGGMTNSTSLPNLQFSAFCLLEGTLISTPNGEVPIENLKKGDLIDTLTGSKNIREVLTNTYYCSESLCPCIIPANTYESNIPHKDLYCTQWHALYIDGKFHHANCLGYKPDTTYLGKKITYYHICLENYPEVIYANGMGVETSGYHFRPRVSNECSENECKIIVI
jgi:hypothetical protein